MSGGSYGYICYRFEEECCGRMYDVEMNDLVKDLAKLLHDLEWWQSSDTSEETYRKSVAEFKEKWFKGNREDRLKKYVEEQCDTLKAELIQMIGG